MTIAKTIAQQDYCHVLPNVATFAASDTKCCTRPLLKASLPSRQRSPLCMLLTVYCHTDPKYKNISTLHIHVVMANEMATWYMCLMTHGKNGNMKPSEYGTRWRRILLQSIPMESLMILVTMKIMKIMLWSQFLLAAPTGPCSTLCSYFSQNSSEC